MKYIDAETLDRCRDAFRFGVPLLTIAISVGIDVSHLAQLLGMKNRPPAIADEWTPIVHRWAHDALDGIL